MAPPKKRAAPSQGSTLLDFFRDQNGRAQSTPRKKSKSDSEVQRPRVKERSWSGLTAADAIVIEDEEVATSSNNQASSNVEVTEDREGLSFGLPILLSSSPPQVEEGNGLETKLDGGCAEKCIMDDCFIVELEKPVESSTLSSVQNGSLIDDEWSLGDDEVVENYGDGYEDDEEEIGTDEEKSSDDTTCEKACPLCGVSIVGMSGWVS
jgi:hypothetical protein